MSTTRQSLSAQNPWSPDGWRRALVYGLGLSGRAAAGLLLRRGVEVVGVDCRDEGELSLGALAETGHLETLLGREPEALPAGLDGLVVSPGVPPDRPLLVAARAAGLPILSEVELAFPLLCGPVVGITGTNGKSTTTELTGAMLAAAGHAVEVCGNIGRPLSDRVEGPADRLFVVELSSFQLENLVNFRPRAAALLNLAQDHLDRYSGFDAYAAAKMEMFRNQGPQDQAVLNGDDDAVRRLAGGLRARRRFFSRAGAVTDGCFVEEERVIEIRPGQAPMELFARRDLHLEGTHNLENAMAAALLARAFGAAPADLRRGLESFQGLPHRMVRVRQRGGVSYFDDSKGTNFAATAKSLEGLPDGTVHLILGGRHKGDDPGHIAELVRRKVRRLYLIGEASDLLAEAYGELVAWEASGTLEKAVDAAAAQAAPGEAVLLSPACASYDQFRDYGQRGDRFQQLVRELGEVSRG